MAYIGRNPAIGTQKVLDSLESQFNGSLTTFNLRYNSNTIYPTLASSLIVSLGGVLQEPGTAYTVASDQIVFASAPPTGTDCWILLYSEFGAIAGASTNLTIGNSLTVQGATDLDGNIDIDAGQITYTASSNIAKFADNAKLIFGAGDDLQIYHDPDDARIENSNGDVKFKNTGSYFFFDEDGGETLASFINDGAVNLYYNNSKKIETTSTGVSVTGTSSATTLSTGASGTGVNISTNTISGPATLTIDPAAVGDDTGTVEIKGNLTVQGTTTTINSTTVDLDHLSLGDSEKAFFGSGNDLEIFHNGSGSFIRQIGTGNLFITALRDTADISINTDDGSGGTCTYIKADGNNGKVKLHHYGTEKLQTTASGVTVSGTVAADGVSLGDGEKIIFGDNEDLRIFHDNSGSQNLINSFTSVPLVIMSNGDTSIKSNNGDKMGVFKKNAGVELYFDDNKKIETTNTGVTVTGALEVSAATNITVGGTALPSLTGLLGGSLRGTLGVVTMHMTSSDPGSPVQGQFYFNSLDQKAKIYTGSSFVDLVPSGGGGGGGGGGSSSDANATFRKYTYSISSATNSVTGSSDIVTDAGDFITGLKYTIKSVGTTDFTAIGASANSVGTVFTATGAGSGNGEAYDTLIYSTGGDQNVEVYVNGVKAVEGASNDYVATNGSSVNFVANLASGDVVDIQVYELLTNDAFVLASGGTFSGNVGINTSGINNRLHVHSSGNDEGILLTQGGNNYSGIIASANRVNPDNYILNLQANWNGNGVARISFETGDDTTNKDDGRIKFSTSSGSSNPNVRMHIAPNGNVGIGLAENTNAEAKLEVKGDGTLTGSHSKYMYSSSCGIQVKGNEAGIDLLGSATGDHASSILLRNAADGFAILSDPTKDALHIRSFTPSADDFYVHSTGSQLSSLTNIATFTKAGEVLIGPQTARVITTTVKPAFQVEGTTFHKSALSIMRNTADAHPPYLILGKSRSTTLGGDVILVDNDKLGEIRFGGSDGVDMANFGAEILAEVDGTPAANSMPGALVFSTSPGGGVVEALRITSAGQVNVKGGILNLGTADSSSGHINAFENMSFNIDTDNDDTNRYFSFHTNSASASGTELVRITESGSVGIGTINPTQKLHAMGSLLLETTSATGNAWTYYKNADRTYLVGVRGSSNDALSFYDLSADAERMRITTSGDVGIGTDAPTSDGGTTLEVYDATTPTLRLNDGGEYKALFQLRGNDLEIRGSNGLMEFYTGNVDGASSTVQMVIENNGNVGVGTNNPGSKLDVNGVVRIHQRTASVPARLCFKSAASNQSPTARIEFWEGNSIGNSVDAHMAFEYDGATTYGGDGTLLIKGLKDSADQVIAGFNRDGDGFVASGNFAVGATNFDNGDLDTGAGFGTPKIKAQGGSGTGFELMGLFRSGNDSDNTGSAIVINHSNDRGIALYGGRGSGNKSYGVIKSISNTGAVADAWVMGGADGAGVESQSFKTGATNATTERIHLTASNVILNHSSSDLTASHSFIAVGEKAAFQYDGNSGTWFGITNAVADGVITLEANARTGDWPDLHVKVGNNVGLKLKHTEGSAHFRDDVYFGVRAGTSDIDTGRLRAISSSSNNYYGADIQHSMHVVLTNEQGTTCQAMTLGDTGAGTDGSVLWAVSVLANTSDPTTGTESGWAQKARVEGNGDFVIAGSYTPSGSDDRLKKNKVTITNALSKVQAMEGFTFEWNDIADKIGMSDGDRHLGLSAQTVEALVPEVVVVNDTLKNPDDGTNDYKTIRYEKLVPLLIEAMKEQQGIIDQLKQRLDDAGL